MYYSLRATFAGAGRFSMLLHTTIVDFGWQDHVLCGVWAPNSIIAMGGLPARRSFEVRE